jgi:predicted nucleic acid-binding protein
VGTIEFDTEAAAHTGAIRVDVEKRGAPIGFAVLLTAATAARWSRTTCATSPASPTSPPEDWY